MIIQMAQPALDLVIAALEKIRETSDHLPRASRIVLARLQIVPPVAVSLLVTPELREGGREASASPTGRRLQPASNKAELLEPIRERVRVCTKCAHLACSRTQTVFGVGNPDADLMFIGEAPGIDEDKQGEPFVGRAGQLLTKIIKAMNFAREDVYIANILKCRPDTPAGSFGNRAPTPTEMQTCRPYLVEQIEIIQRTSAHERHRPAGTFAQPSHVMPEGGRNPDFPRCRSQIQNCPVHIEQDRALLEIGNQRRCDNIHVSVPRGGPAGEWRCDLTQ